MRPGHKQSTGLAALVIAASLIVTSLVGGCSGDGASLLSEATQPAVTTSASSGAGPVVLGAAAPAPAARFDPFTSDGVSDGPVREVIANPTLAQVLEPGELPEFSLGRADAPVVMVKYMSLTCPHCRRFMAETFPGLKRDYVDTGKVRLIIREFPIGRASGNATIALRCAPMGQYLALYKKFLEQQSAWVAQEVKTDAIFKVASQVGVTRDQFDACMANQGMIGALNRVKERGRTLGIIGTPNFFIANRLVKTVIGMTEIRQIVDPMLVGQPTTEAARRG